jgi:NADPH:quinone reductase-like Zn-dependent oxidoreductase
MEMGIYKPIVAREMPLAEAAAAHREVLEPHAPGNLVLIP